MDEKNKIQENSSEENQVKKTDSKILSKFTPKIAVIFGAALFVLILFIAIISAGGKDNNDDDGDYSDNSSQSGSGNYGNNEGATNNGGANNGNNSSNNNNNGGNSSNGNTATKPLIIGNFVTGYSEGLAFVKEKYGSDKTNCIDKNGNIIFSIENISGSDNSGFHNGWAMLKEYDTESGKSKYILCDKLGNIKTAEELGGNSFIFNQEAFEDGYILVKKTTTNYQGSIDELAVFNAELEKNVDFSEEMYERYNQDWRFYYKGFLYDYDLNCLNLQTGAVGFLGDDLFFNVTLDNKSDLWDSNDDFYYDFRDLNKIPILYKDDNAYSYAFVDGYAGVIFSVKDSQVGERNYFTIMDENGDYCFEPIETFGLINRHYSRTNKNGVFVVYSTNISDNKHAIQVFDKTGRIGYMEFEMHYSYLLEVLLSDGVICVRIAPTFSKDYKTVVGVYNTKLEPLFEVQTNTQ